MAVIIGTKSGFIGDTNDGFNLHEFLLKQLGIQCIEQHQQQDESFKPGRIVKLSHDAENGLLRLKYENGETWQYERIDHGSDGMIATKID